MGRILTRPRTPVAAQLLRPDIKPHGPLILKPDHIHKPNVLAVLYNDKLTNGVSDLTGRDFLTATGGFSYTHRGMALDASTSKLVSAKNTGVTAKFSAILKMRQIDGPNGTYMVGQYTATQLKWGTYYQSSNNTYYGYFRPQSSGTTLISFGILDDDYPITFGLSYDGAVLKGFLNGRYHSQASRVAAIQDGVFGVNYQESTRQENELSLVWDYALPDAAMEEYTTRPYSLFRAANDRVFLFPGAVIPPTAGGPPAGSLSLIGVGI